MEKVALYAGSFDPITLGHLDIVKRSLKLFDKIIIAVGNNNNKSYLFSIDERVKIINKVLGDFLEDGLSNKIEIKSFNSLLVDFAKEQRVNIVIRGIRMLSDFDFEFNLAGVNAKLDPKMETIFLIASEQNQFVSSRTAKEIAEFGGDLTKFLPQSVINILQKKLSSS